MRGVVRPKRIAAEPASRVPRRNGRVGPGAIPRIVPPVVPAPPLVFRAVGLATSSTKPYLDAYAPPGYSRRTMADPNLKKKLVARLRRIAGQVEGIARMIEEDRYCVDVLLQVAAAQAALGTAGALVLRSHVDTCVSEAMTNGTAAQRKKKIDELMNVFSRYSRMTG